MAVVSRSRDWRPVGAAPAEYLRDEPTSAGDQHANRPGAQAVLIVASAGWHKAGGDLLVPANISLLHLPPYSRELKRVENVWQFLRENFLSNRVYDDYRAIADACCAAGTLS